MAARFGQSLLVRQPVRAKVAHGLGQLWRATHGETGRRMILQSVTNTGQRMNGLNAECAQRIRRSDPRTQEHRWRAIRAAAEHDARRLNPTGDAGADDMRGDSPPVGDFQTIHQYVADDLEIGSGSRWVQVRESRVPADAIANIDRRKADLRHAVRVVQVFLARQPRSRAGVGESSMEMVRPRSGSTWRTCKAARARSNAAATLAQSQPGLPSSAQAS